MRKETQTEMRRVGDREKKREGETKREKWRKKETERKWSERETEGREQTASYPTINQSRCVK